MPAGHPVADVLRLLAGCDSTGVLHVPGPPAGSFHLDGGRVTVVSTDAVPPGAGRRPVLDATLALLSGGGRLLPPRFTTGGPAAPDGPRWEVASLLAEVEQARAVLAAAGVGADDEVTLRPLARRSVRVDAATWPVIGALAAGGPATPRRLAWALGATVLDTVLAVADVVDQGAGEVLRTAAPATAAATTAAGAGETSGAGRDPGTVPIPVLEQAPRRDRTARPAPGPLPVRRPGASLPDPGSRSRPGGPGTEATGGFIAVPADLPAEIVLRLLDGLRRL